LDIGVLGYIGIVQHKEHSPEVLSIPPGTPCISYQLCFWLPSHLSSFPTQRGWHSLKFMKIVRTSRNSITNAVKCCVNLHVSSVFQINVVWVKQLEHSLLCDQTACHLIGYSKLSPLQSLKKYWHARSCHPQSAFIHYATPPGHRK